MFHQVRIGLPEARSEGLLVEAIGDEYVIFDTAVREAHCLSPLAARVFERCDGRTRLEDVAAEIGSRLGTDVDVATIETALAELGARGLLVEPPLVGDPGGMSRRTLVKRTAVATAALSAAPLVTSIVTPAYAQASDRRCPGARCVSQEKGDEFCACNNVCPPGSPGAGGDSSCTDLGYTPPYFDSCFCAKCPTPSDPNPGQVPAGFLQFCLPPEQQTSPCTGDGDGDGGCQGSGKPLDGICVPNDGDSSEPCVTP